jgi:hypothetical protein
MTRRVSALTTRILGLGIYLLWFAAVFDPVGNLGRLRYLSLGYAVLCIAVFLTLRPVPGTDKTLRNLVVACMTLLMPIYGLVLYSVRGGSTDFDDTSYIAAGILLLTVSLYKNADLCRIGVRAMVFALRLLTLVIVYIYLTVVLGYNYEWVRFFTEGNAALISTREYGGTVLPYIYFLASPMLIYLIGHDIHAFSRQRTRYRLGVCALTLFAFGLSGTRAHIILAFAYVPVYLFFMASPQRKLLIGAGVLVVATAMLAMKPGIVGEFFSTQEASNELKLRLLDMYEDVFANPATLLFGQGYNAHEWYGPLREKFAEIPGASKTELTYLELVRVYGLLITTTFIGLMITLTVQLSKVRDEYLWTLPAFVIFMFNAAFNPYLFSTNGILPLALLLAIVSLDVHFENRRHGTRQWSRAAPPTLAVRQVLPPPISASH